MPDSEKQSALHTRHTLLERIKDPHDEKSWKEFISYYEQYIYNILRSIRIPENDASELKQDIILLLWKKLPEFAYDRDKGKFRHWLSAVIRNAKFNYFNKKNRENAKASVQDNETLSRNADEKSSLDIDKIINDEWEHFISNVAWESVKKSFNKSVQQVFIHSIEGKTPNEIASLCDMKVNTVHSYVMRIRNHLKDEIEQLNRDLL